METTKKFCCILLLVLISLFLTSNIFSQTGWVQLNSGNTGSFTHIYFINQNTGFLGNPFMKSTNGGLNWSLVSFPWVGYKMFFVNANTGYYAADSVLKTTNAGNSWINTGAGSSKQFIHFINNDTGFVAGRLEPGGLSGIIRTMKTTNGGVNWTVSKFTEPFDFITSAYTSIYFPTSQTGYLGEFLQSQNENIISYIYKTTNQGTSWITNVTSDSMWYSSIQFLNENTGYCIAYNASTTSPPLLNAILKCTNNIWQNVYTGYQVFNSLYFINASTGFAVGDTGKMIVTTNGGSSWTPVNLGTNQNLNSVYFFDQLTGYIVGNNGTIFKTTTGGVTPTFYSISGTVKYQDNQQNVTAGYVKAFKYDYSTSTITTIDSTGILSNGTYILPHITQDTLDIMAFQDDEEEQLFVPTYYPSTIYWENAVKIYPTGNLTNINIEVFRINNTIGVYHIGGSVFFNGLQDQSGIQGAVVYAKINNQFKGYSVSNPAGAYSIDLLSSGSYELICNRIGYYCNNRTLQITSNNIDTINFYLSNTLIKVENSGTLIPEKYNLYQNYPNPFNPSTKIKFDVGSPFNPLLLKEGTARSAGVVLTIYDILGKEIAMLVNEKLTPGTYEVTWNASNYPSGVYFYKLQAGDFIETKKMLLIK